MRLCQATHLHDVLWIPEAILVYSWYHRVCCLNYIVMGLDVKAFPTMRDSSAAVTSLGNWNIACIKFIYDTFHEANRR